MLISLKIFDRYSSYGINLKAHHFISHEKFPDLNQNRTLKLSVFEVIYKKTRKRFQTPL